MANTVVIWGDGTQPSGIVLTVQRKLEKLKGRLRRRLRNAQDSDRASIAQELERLERVIVRAMDVDPTTAFDIPEPLENDTPDFRVGTRLILHMPGPDTVRNIQDGLYQNYPFLNPEAYNAMLAAGNGAGGTRVNGRLSAEAHRTRLENEIRAILESIASHRAEMADNAAETVVVFLIAGLYGGFGTGTYDLVRRLWMCTAEELKVKIELIPFLLVPAAHKADDPQNTKSLAYSVLKEQQAQATQRCLRREHPKGAPKPVNVKNHWRPAVLVSDTNASPGKPRILPRKNFNGMMAALLVHLSLTGLGERLISKLSDFYNAATARNVYGETKHGITIGLGEIVLDRERAFRFLAAVQRCEFLIAAQEQVEDALVQREVRAFLEARSIVLGDGRADLSNLLLERRAENDLVAAERVRQLYWTNLHGMPAADVFQQAAVAMEAAVQQNGDFAEALRRRGGVVQQNVERDAVELERQWMCDHQRGPAAAAQWCDVINQVIANMVAAAGQETADLEQRIADCRSRIEYFQNTYIPHLGRKNFLYRWLHRRSIETNAQQYAQALLSEFEARIRLQAHQAAIAVLTGLAETLKQHQISFEQALAVIKQEQDEATIEIDRVVTHSADMEVPVGLALLANEEDFVELRRRMLPESDRLETVRGVYLHLQQAGELAAVFADTDRLRQALEDASERTLRSKVDSLHVVTELLHRYGQDRDLLGRVLRERDLEATERLVLKDSSEIENGLVLVRLLGMEAGRENEILPILNEYAEQRQHAYTHVRIDDPERIVLVQIRAVFPLSDWAGCEAALQDYRNLRSVTKVERQHELPGDRNLPELGQKRTKEEASLLAVRAFVLGRLKYEGGEWILAPADAALGSTSLGAQLEHFIAPEGYAVAVDVVSHFGCYYLEHGPTAIREKLRRIQTPSADPTPTELEIAKLYSSEIRRDFEEELVWWETNTVPAAMEWGRRKNKAVI
jgi:hypothetical protein